MACGGAPEPRRLRRFVGWRAASVMSGAAPPVIGSIGELLVEFVCTEQGGRNLRAAPYVGPFPSGAPGIFIDQAARVGARAVFAGAVGNDAFGQVLRDRLAAAGVAGDLIRVVPGVPTGTAHVSYNPDGSRDFVFNIAHSAAGLLPSTAACVAGFLAAGTQVIHISGSTLGDPAMRARAFEVCTALAEAGVAISLDPNIRTELLADTGYLAVVRELMAMATYVLPSDDDAAILFPGEPFSAWAGALIAGGARAVVLKSGAQGCRGMAGQGRGPAPGPPGYLGRKQGSGAAGVSVGEHGVALAAHRVTVVDPTGAGDCFCATFVTLCAMGYPLADALIRANAAGALAVGQRGPMAGNATLAQIEAFLAEQG